MNEIMHAREELKHCPSCGGFKETKPGFPLHEEDIQPCLCDCETDRRDKEEAAKRQRIVADEV